MDQKAVVKLKIDKNEKPFYFEMPIGAPFGEAYDAAFDFLQEIIRMSKDAADRAKREEVTEEVEKEES